MGTDPHPYKALLVLDGKCPVIETNSSRPEFSGFLEVKRRMVWIVFEQRVVLPCQVLRLF
jgi:hypothetical protein